MSTAFSMRYWNKIVFVIVIVIVQPLVVFFVIVIVAAFGSAYLPPHLFAVFIGKDTLFLSFGMVA